MASFLLFYIDINGFMNLPGIIGSLSIKAMDQGEKFD